MNKRTILRLTLLLAACCAGQLHAQQQVLPKYTIGTPFATKFDSTQVFMEDNGLSYVQNHKRLLMLTEAGCKENSVVKMDYDPLSAYVEIKQVVVHRHNGGNDTIVNAAMQNRVYDYIAPARLIYWGASQKMVEIGHLDPYDEVEIWTFKKGFTYALLTDENQCNGGTFGATSAAGDDDKYIPPMRGHFYDIVPFWSATPIDLKVYSLNILNSKTLQYQVYNGELEHTASAIDSSRTLHVFTKHNIQPMTDAESHMVAHNDVECKLLLSTSPNWQAKSTWFYGVNEDYGSFKSTPELSQKVAELLKPAKNELDSISILTHWVADNMRYAGISMGPGEGFTLHNAQMNYTDRCGVCKDKAGLLIAMLRAAGFKAYASMTMAGERIERVPADQFNHSVCVVQRRNGQYELLDPTWVPNVRELWSSAEQQQGYLMGLPQGADLQYTPVSPAEKHYIRLIGKSKLEKDGTLKGEFTITAEGQSDNAVRRIAFGSRMSEWQSNLERELLKIDPRAEITSVSYTDNDEYLKQPVRITYKYKIPGYAIVTDEEIIFIPVLARDPFRNAMGHLFFDENEETRKYPFADRCSRLVQISEAITLPEGYKNLIFDKEVKGVVDAAADFGCQYMMNGNVLNFGENIMLNKRVYQPQDWPAFRYAVKYQKILESTPVILTK
jgi:hypothetical protein